MFKHFGTEMIHTLLIFLGAGVGGVCRYWLATGVYLLLSRQFPYGTLFVNATGAFLMGLLYVLILERFNGIGPQLRALLLIGFLGGYTTFSSFSIETLHLFERGEWMSATLNIVISVSLCLTLTCLGMLGGRHL
jgi:CrcB protein